MPVLKTASFAESLKENPSFKDGCIVDTNILFASTFADDFRHEEAFTITQCLEKYDIPILINVNIRAEFINLALKIIIPQALCGFFRDYGSDLPELLYKKLKSINQLVNDGIKSGKNFKMQNQKIKEIRFLLSSQMIFGVDV